MRNFTELFDDIIKKREFADLKDLIEILGTDYDVNKNKFNYECTATYHRGDSQSIRDMKFESIFCPPDIKYTQLKTESFYEEKSSIIPLMKLEDDGPYRFDVELCFIECRIIAAIIQIREKIEEFLLSKSKYVNHQINVSEYDKLMSCVQDILIKRREKYIIYKHHENGNLFEKHNEDSPILLLINAKSELMHTPNFIQIIKEDLRRSFGDLDVCILVFPFKKNLNFLITDIDNFKYSKEIEFSLFPHETMYARQYFSTRIRHSFMHTNISDSYLI